MRVLYGSNAEILITKFTAGVSHELVASMFVNMFSRKVLLGVPPTILFTIRDGSIWSPLRPIKRSR